jgi:hypothetical protein
LSSLTDQLATARKHLADLQAKSKKNYSGGAGAIAIVRATQAVRALERSVANASASPSGTSGGAPDSVNVTVLQGMKAAQIASVRRGTRLDEVLSSMNIRLHREERLRVEMGGQTIAVDEPSRFELNGDAMVTAVMNVRGGARTA